jgi:DNA-directed RNA polymerase specialized sigma24 family protein
MHGRSEQTLSIERMLQDGQSISSIARSQCLTRGRVQSIKRRMLTRSSPIHPAGTQTAPFVKDMEGNSLTLKKPIRTETPPWANSHKSLMLRCIPPSHMRRFKVAQMYWMEGMTIGDISTAMSISIDSIKKIIYRLKDKS